MHAEAEQTCTETYMTAQDVLLELLWVKRLLLCVIPNKPLHTMGNVKATVKSTLQSITASASAAGT